MKGKYHCKRSKKEPLRLFYNHLVNVSLTILTHVHASTHRLSFRYSVLVPLFPLVSISTMFFDYIKNSSREKVLLLSLEIKGAKASGLM